MSNEFVVDEIENRDYVICRLCNKRFKKINNFHLEGKHRITISDYKNSYPDAVLIAEVVNNIGQVAWNKGKKATPEMIEKNRIGHLGHVHTEEHKANIGASLKGYVHSVERNAKISKALKGKTLSESHKQAMSECRKGIKLSEEHKLNIGKGSKIAWENMSQEQRSKISIKLSKMFKGRILTDDWKNKISIGHKKTYASMSQEQRDVNIKIQMKGRNLKINALEIIVDDLLQELYPGEFKFVGNGDFVLGGKCPDFVNINSQKKIIEVFGEYWHKDDKHNKGQDRKDLFKEYGYETLILWEKDIKGNLDNVKKELEQFV